MTGAQVKTVGVGVGLGMTALSAAATWVGIRTGLKDGGLIGVAGWAVGIAGAVFGSLTLLGTAQLLFASNEELNKAAAEAQAPTATPASMPLLETV